MRSLFQVIFLILAVALSRISPASTYDTMPTPPPTPATEMDQTKEDKGKVKRGLHWYRKPSCATPAEQMALAYRYYEEGRYRKAANAYQALVYAWPDTAAEPLAYEWVAGSPK